MRILEEFEKGTKKTTGRRASVDRADESIDRYAKLDASFDSYQSST